VTNIQRYGKSREIKAAGGQRLALDWIWFRSFSIVIAGEEQLPIGFRAWDPSNSKTVEWLNSTRAHTQYRTDYLKLTYSLPFLGNKGISAHLV